MRSCLLVLLLLIGCTKSKYTGDYQPSPKPAIVDRICRDVSIKLNKENNLHLCDCGGRMMNAITHVHMGFFLNEEIEIQKAREILIIATNLLLQAVNADEEIRPYLATYPFTPKNIEIRIFLSAPNKGKVSFNKLSAISMLEGVLDYYINDKETGRLKLISTETFDEALVKLDEDLSVHLQRKSVM